MANKTFADLAAVKSRLHIDSDDTDQDDYIQDLANDADHYVNVQLALVADPVPVGVNTDKELRSLANKHAAAEYIWWNSPDHPRAGLDKARQDIQDHIMTKYAKTNPSGLTNSTVTKTSSRITGLG